MYIVHSTHRFPILEVHRYIQNIVHLVSTVQEYTGVSSTQYTQFQQFRITQLYLVHSTLSLNSLGVHRYIQCIQYTKLQQFRSTQIYLIHSTQYTQLQQFKSAQLYLVHIVHQVSTVQEYTDISNTQYTYIHSLARSTQIYLEITPSLPSLGVHRFIQYIIHQALTVQEYKKYNSSVRYTQ